MTKAITVKNKKKKIEGEKVLKEERVTRRFQRFAPKSSITSRKRI